MDGQRLFLGPDGIGRGSRATFAEPGRITAGRVGREWPRFFSTAVQQLGIIKDGEPGAGRIKRAKSNGLWSGMVARRMTVIGIGLALAGVGVGPWALAVAAAGRPATTGVWAAGSRDEPARVYQQKCADCHGPDGQGVAGVYEVALSGDRSIAELTRLIERTMPEGAPEDCVADEAAAVAGYIYHDFYSPAARVRRGLDAPLQVELARLTVPQYRNAVADVMAFFTPPPQAARRQAGARRRGGGRDPARQENAESSAQPGLRASYFASEGMSKANKLIQSVIDPKIDFDFGETAPHADLPADQFAIVWEGSLAVRETGDYRLRVSTPNGARVYLNLDPNNGLHKLRDDSASAGQFPLIDAWVGSGEMRQESARVFLLGGREYPLRVEFFKYQEPTASLRLEWKPPQGVWSVLDQEHLSSGDASRTFVVESSFPADDRSLGFERGASISPDWYTAVTTAAVAAAEEVVNRLPLLAGVEPLPEVKDGQPDAAALATAQALRTQQMQDFVVRFASLAFRRPLTAEEADRLRIRPFADQLTPEAGVRRAVVWILCAPEFLYTDLRPNDTQSNAFAVANRLALTLWDSVPDQPLWSAAQAGDLLSPDAVESHARRMLSDRRTRHKLDGFFQHWLHLEERDLTKDSQLFPEFDERVIADLRHSLELLLDQVVWGETSDYRQLLLTEEVWLNSQLRQAYVQNGADGHPEGAGPGTGREGAAGGEGAVEGASDSNPFQPVVLPGGQRAGVLTHPYLLSALAYHNNTSPIHRGVFVTRNVLGRALRAPPVAIAFENDDFPVDLTMRQKVTHLTQDASCLSCHTIINPLGFSLETFDAMGRWRETEHGRHIDATSDYETEDGEVVRLTGPRDVAELAVTRTAAHRAFVSQLFQHLTKQVPAAYGPEVLAELVAGFEADNFHIQNLMVRIAVLVARPGTSPAVHDPSHVENPR